MSEVVWTWDVTDPSVACSTRVGDLLLEVECSIDGWIGLIDGCPADAGSCSCITDMQELLTEVARGRQEASSGGSDI